MKARVIYRSSGPVYLLDGREVTREEYDAALPDRPLEGAAPMTESTSAWPIKSDALGVHPKQAREAEEHARQKGVPTEFTPQGQPVFRSREHRKQYCRAYGVYDRNGGYGDP